MLQNIKRVMRRDSHQQTVAVRKYVMSLLDDLKKRDPEFLYSPCIGAAILTVKPAVNTTTHEVTYQASIISPIPSPVLIEALEGILADLKGKTAPQPVEEGSNQNG